MGYSFFTAGCWKMEVQQSRALVGAWGVVHVYSFLTPPSGRIQFGNHRQIGRSQIYLFLYRSFDSNRQRPNPKHPASPGTGWKAGKGRVIQIGLEVVGSKTGRIRKNEAKNGNRWPKDNGKH